MLRTAHPNPVNSIVVLLASVGLPCGAAAQPTFQGIGDLPEGRNESRANAVSRDGRVVVGQSNSLLGLEAIKYAQDNQGVWVMTSLQDLAGGSVSAFALDASLSGSVIVGSGTTDDGRRGWEYREPNGPMVDLPLDPLRLLTRDIIARAVSEAGSLAAGYGWNANLGNPIGHGLRWDSGGATILQAPLSMDTAAEAINRDGSVIAGRGSPPGTVHQACRWDNGATMATYLPFLPGGSLSGVQGMTPDGSVLVGTSTSTSFPAGEFCMWRNGVPIGLGAWDRAFRAYATAIRDDARVVVGSNAAAREEDDVAIIWDESRGIRRLQDRLQNDYGLNLSGWHLRIAYDLSADGLVIVGVGNNPSGWLEGWVATLPCHFAPDGVSAPSSQVVCADERAQFSVSATHRDPVAYRWQRFDGSLWQGVTDGPRPSGAIVSGATTPLLRIDNAQTPEAGEYRCVVSNFCGRVESAGATLLVSDCYADCDCASAPGTLDIFDFLCFQNRFDAGDPYACDCDTFSGRGVCDIFDFLCFQNAFAAGCP